MSTVNWSAVAGFYVLACLAAIGGVLIAPLLVPWGIAFIITPLIMWTPGIAAIAVTWWMGRPVLATLGVRIGRWPWSLAALFAPIGLILCMIALGFVLPGADWDPSIEGMISRIAGSMPAERQALIQSKLEGFPIHPALLGLLAAPVAGATVNSALALGEELGWRGWLYDALAPLGFWRANLLGGAMWGLWHAPLIVNGHNWPEHPWLGVGMMTLACALFAPVLGFFRERSDSVISAMFLHGTFNASAAILILVFDGSSLFVHPLGFLGMGAMICANLLIAAVRRSAPQS